MQDSQKYVELLSNDAVSDCCHRMRGTADLCTVAQITSSFLLLVSSWFGLKAMSITRAAHQQSIAFLQSLSNKQNGWKSVVSSWESTVSQVEPYARTVQLSCAANPHMAL